MTLQPTGNFGNYFSQESRESSRYVWIENYTVKPLHFAGEHTSLDHRWIEGAIESGLRTAFEVHAS